jgi:hypothetical protein
MSREVLAQGGDCILVAGFININEECGFVVVVRCDRYSGNVVKGDADLGEGCTG